MLSGATASAFAIAGTAVFRIVVSSDSMKKATATSHGNNRFTESPGAAGDAETALELAGIMLPPADYLVATQFQFRIARRYLFNAETQRTQSATPSNSAFATAARSATLGRMLYGKGRHSESPRRHLVAVR